MSILIAVLSFQREEKQRSENNQIFVLKIYSVCHFKSFKLNTPQRHKKECSLYTHTQNALHKSVRAFISGESNMMSVFYEFDMQMMLLYGTASHPSILTTTATKQSM